jgi:hypothetical protein
MAETIEDTGEFRDDLDRRQSRVRQSQLLLAAEQWAPADEDFGDGWLLEVCTIMDATDDEAAWLGTQVARVGRSADDQQDSGEWHEIRRTRGRLANAAATAAFLAGEFGEAHDRVDEARAYGALLESEWRGLHALIAARAAETG